MIENLEEKEKNGQKKIDMSYEPTANGPKHFKPVIKECTCSCLAIVSKIKVEKQKIRNIVSTRLFLVMKR
jgi:hypothetical protein